MAMAAPSQTLLYPLEVEEDTTVAEAGMSW